MRVVAMLPGDIHLPAVGFKEKDAPALDQISAIRAPDASNGSASRLQSFEEEAVGRGVARRHGRGLKGSAGPSLSQTNSTTVPHQTHRHGSGFVAELS